MRSFETSLPLKSALLPALEMVHIIRQVSARLNIARRHRPQQVRFPSTVIKLPAWGAFADCMAPHNHSFTAWRSERALELGEEMLAVKTIGRSRMAGLFPAFSDASSTFSPRSWLARVLTPGDFAWRRSPHRSSWSLIRCLRFL